MEEINRSIDFFVCLFVVGLVETLVSTFMRLNGEFICRYRRLTPDLVTSDRIYFIDFDLVASIESFPPLSKRLVLCALV